ncbi:MAG: hypothetical protein IPL53_13825 [Ignavibacteria bacterium]|nr:hypothetical protein [Ignavibacteria bacterium]
MQSQGKIILALSIPLAVLVIITSLVGIFAPGFYSNESLNWQVQSYGQDIIDLFLILPFLLITSILASRNNKPAKLLWGGVVLYLTYTFIIFCFDIHFNQLFFLYCMELGLSFYSFMYFLFTERNEKFPEQFKNSFIVKFTAVYLILVSALFYFLWLAEILPSIINNTTPKSLIETGLITNPVHVIDLSVVLPGIFLTGIFLLKGKSAGLILAPSILMFFILMDITIGFLVVVMNKDQPEADFTLTVVMSVLALVSLVTLIRYFHKVQKVH